MPSYLNRYFGQGGLGDMLYVAADTLITAVTGTKAAGKGPVLQSDLSVAWIDIATQAELDAIQAYIDAKLAGLSWKQAVRAATTVAGTLASSLENGDAIDGVTLATGDRILVKNQATASENGIYVVNASGAPTRATDADAGAELVNATCYVSEGTTNADTQWTCSTNAPITVGSTSIAFAQLSSGGITDPELLALSGLTSAADKLPYFTGSGTAGLTDLSSTGRSLIDDTSTSAMRTTLGLGGAAVLNVGTAAGTVAAGDDSRFTGITANTQTASYVLVLADAGKSVEMNVAGANTLTVPPNSSVAFPVGTVIEVHQYGAGQVTLTPGAGVTLRSAAGLTTRAQYSTVSLRKRGTDEWVVAGDVT